MINCTIKGVNTPYKVDYVRSLHLENVKINGEMVIMPDTLKVRRGRLKGIKWEGKRLKVKAKSD